MPSVKFQGILGLAVDVCAALAELTKVLQSRSPSGIRCGSMDGQLEILQATKKEQQKPDDGYVGMSKVQFLCFPLKTEDT